jgi:formylglycine-generating enzyme
MNLKNLVLLLSCAATVASCKNGKLFGKKAESSSVTGWNYNDKNQGGYQVAREKEQRTGPGLVFVQGGTFAMGASEEDVMGDWNNIPRRVTVNSFYNTRKYATQPCPIHWYGAVSWRTMSRW